MEPLKRDARPSVPESSDFDTRFKLKLQALEGFSQCQPHLQQQQAMDSSINALAHDHDGKRRKRRKLNPYQREGRQRPQHHSRCSSSIRTEIVQLHLALVWSVIVLWSFLTLVQSNPVVTESSAQQEKIIDRSPYWQRVSVAREKSSGEGNSAELTP